MDGIEVEAITSPLYPHRDSMVDDFEFDGINYHRVLHPSRVNENSKITHKIIKKFTKLKNSEKPQNPKVKINKKMPLKVFDFCYYGVFKVGRICLKPFRILWKITEEKVLIKHFEESIVVKYRDQNVGIIHAHTPYRVGLPALKAARRLGIPFVYEMRGMWEETAVANRRWRNNGLAHRRFKRMENKVLRAADSVVTISESLKKVAIERGVDPKKIVTVTNGVEESFINHTTKSSSFDQVKQKLLSKRGEIVVGYIGSLREMEGVDLTARAVSDIVKSGTDISFFCLTGAAGQDELKQLCNNQNISDHSLITGPVPHYEVPVFYDLIDIFVVSRPDFEVTRKVTPLKPFEAMGRGLPVIVSDLEALTEIIQDKTTGVVVEPNDVKMLSKSIMELVENPVARDELGKNASAWVRQNRLWRNVVEETRKAYEIAQGKN